MSHKKGTTLIRVKQVNETMLCDVKMTLCVYENCLYSQTVSIAMFLSDIFDFINNHCYTRCAIKTDLMKCSSVY